MAERPSTDMAARLLAEGFSRAAPPAAALSDPITDTPIIVTLDQLRPYDLNPRVTRNPLYEEVKASIRERGLDSPPAVTRRPEAPTYIIRNGGNTRLAILNELWVETREERFFRIPCLFRPWSPRGDIVALTGHLAENELHGGLSFIERALGVEKARELYEVEIGEQVSQAELARRLAADGYPLQQSLLSRMHDAVRWLLPAIPNVLYGGLGRPLIERLIVLRRAAERVWTRRAASLSLDIDFPMLFQDVLVQFDGDLDAFAVQRVQDELVGQMGTLLQVNYDLLQLEIDNPGARQYDPSPPVPPWQPTATSPDQEAAFKPNAPHAEGQPLESLAPSKARNVDTPSAERATAPPLPTEPTTERLQAIEQLIAQSLDDGPDDLAQPWPGTETDTALADKPHAPAGDGDQGPLRVRIFALAREVAADMGLEDAIAPASDGLGYRATLPTSAGTTDAALLGLMAALAQADPASAPASLPGLGVLLCGGDASPSTPARRLSDSGLARLLRMIRLARRLHDLGHNAAARNDTR